MQRKLILALLCGVVLSGSVFLVIQSSKWLGLYCSALLEALLITLTVSSSRGKSFNILKPIAIIWTVCFIIFSASLHEVKPLIKPQGLTDQDLARLAEYQAQRASLQADLAYLKDNKQTKNFILQQRSLTPQIESLNRKINGLLEAQQQGRVLLIDYLQAGGVLVSRLLIQILNLLAASMIGTLWRMGQNQALANACEGLASPLRTPHEPLETLEVEESANPQPPLNGKPSELVRRIYPKAKGYKHNGSYVIVSDPNHKQVIGRGPIPVQAWESSLKNILSGNGGTA